MNIKIDNLNWHQIIQRVQGIFSFPDLSLKHRQYPAVVDGKKWLKSPFRLRHSDVQPWLKRVAQSLYCSRLDKRHITGNEKKIISRNLFHAAVQPANGTGIIN
jgi:hypothetical protein